MIHKQNKPREFKYLRKFSTLTRNTIICRPNMYSLCSESYIISLWFAQILSIYYFNISPCFDT